MLLVLAPWSGLWERNYFAYLLPWLGPWMASAYVRGAVTGIGLVTALGGLRDLVSAFMMRHTPVNSSSPQ